MNIALLIIDVQEAFVGDRRGKKEFEDTLAYINETAKLFRNAGRPVIVVRDIEEGDGERMRNVEELQTGETDFELLKEYSNSFWKTNLEEMLREREVDFVVNCGNAAEHCILATYNGARERGFGTAMLQHGIFAEHPDSLLDIYRNRALISYGVISYMLRS
ncbi:isochorismatase family protein [Paenibacillus sp. TRM 82003]|nr:isochorismatase family protein [Paenibacillus sp. TRM 82003]